MAGCSRPLAATAAILAMSSSPGIADDPIAYEDIFSPTGHGRAPTQIRWSESGATLTFLWSESGDRDLWTLEPGAEEARLLLSAEQLENGAETLGLAKARWSKDGSAFLVGQGEKSKYETASVFDELHLYRLADESLTPLGGAGRFEDPRLSPDASQVTFVRDANLWLLDVESGTESSITEDGREGEVLNGKPDWVYWEEIFGRRSSGHWWSPDAQRVAFLRFDEEGVTRHPLLADAEDVLPETYDQPYPTPGTRNPRVRIGVAGVAGEVAGGRRWLEVEGGDDAYIGRVTWTPAGEVAVVRVDREQAAIELLLCDPDDGRCRLAVADERPGWVDIVDDYRVLESGRIVWGSDRDGRRRLYLYAASGAAAVAITPEDLVVVELEAVDETAGTVFWTGHPAAGLGAKDRHLYRSSLDGSDLETLSGGPGWSSSVVAADGGGWVISHSSSIRTPSSTAVRRGRTPVLLPSQAATDYSLAALPAWQFLTIPGPEEAVELPARILRPPDFNPNASYPAIMYHYGGPASQTVQNALGSRPYRDLWHRRQAQRGYVVLNVDNEASAYFGKNGAERLHRRFGELELAGQLAGVAYLESLGYVDTQRIGIWGWSGGGTNTLYSLLHSPGTWAAGVAGAPVTDWRLYDSIWTERYLDHPDHHPYVYRDSSPLTWADTLEDALLLVHGCSDENVNPHNTIMMSKALIEAGKQFEQALYPDEKHGFSRKAKRHFYERMEAFFDRHLREP
ncbi:MAG: DPP IV N-terminal domain-containing protein [Acidobacteriota bacterium]|nr:DPP IV N-terminal domain-containing protein [Acidobacteriota bacterium]